MYPSLEDVQNDFDTRTEKGGSPFATQSHRDQPASGSGDGVASRQSYVKQIHTVQEHHKRRTSLPPTLASLTQPARPKSFKRGRQSLPGGWAECCGGQSSDEDEDEDEDESESEENRCSKGKSGQKIFCADLDSDFHSLPMQLQQMNFNDNRKTDLPESTRLTHSIHLGSKQLQSYGPTEGSGPLNSVKRFVMNHVPPGLTEAARSGLGGSGDGDAYGNPNANGERDVYAQTSRGWYLKNEGPEKDEKEIAPNRTAENQAVDAQQSSGILVESLMKAVDDCNVTTSVSDARAELGLKLNNKIKGVAVNLLPHQLIGVYWMVRQELDEKKKGGILADDMGLGKTVQTISLIVKMQPTISRDFVGYTHSGGRKKRASGGVPITADDGIRRTTLILAPASLLQQWYEEVTDKTDRDTLTAHIHHGPNKLKDVAELRYYDVIITTYQTFCRDFPEEDKEDGKNKNKSGTVKSGNKGSAKDAGNKLVPGPMPVAKYAKPGVLAQMKWLRVVIDEAQNIRNRGTRISESVSKVDSEYCWCLTGTPVTNSLKDLYGFFRFLKFRPWNDWSYFDEHIGSIEKEDPGLAGHRAQALLKSHLLRRTKDSTIDGKPILQLPKKIISLAELEFTNDERSIYNFLEARSRDIVSEFIKEDTVMKNYNFILVLILRLRQLCGHPNLILEKVTKDGKALDNNDPKSLKEISRIKCLMGESRFNEWQERFRARAVERMIVGIDGGGEQEEECAICLESLACNTSVTLCGHEFCTDCMSDLMSGHDKAEGDLQCPVCCESINLQKVFLGSAFVPSQDDLDQSCTGYAGNNMAKLNSAMRELQRLRSFYMPEFRPSTKMVHMLELIQKWRKEEPNDKVIIYSQWTSLLKMVETYLRDHDITSVGYDGKMSRTQRANAISNFKKSSGPSIMLISIKCGGVGLNLTAANRVINLDLSWNFATEAQAYDRVHRLGQFKEVAVERLIIEDTIEGRILYLQARKQALSDGALGEGEARKITKMTRDDIARLFNLLPHKR